MEDAEAFAAQILTCRGTPPENADIQVAVLLEAELRGHPSHGLQRLPRIAERIDRRLIDPATRGAASWKSEAFLTVDGRAGLGPVVARAAIDLMEAQIDETGIVLTAIRDANHLGLLAFYVERIAQKGHIGIALSSSEALVHPHGGTRCLLGTNPIAIAVPARPHPFVVDLATSVVSMGKVHHYARTGRPLEPGWARDVSGQPTEDAERAKAGAIAPFGGAKGYGLGLAFELIVASLTGSALAPDVRGTLDAEVACNKGDVLIAIKPDAVPDIEERVSRYLDLLRQSPAEDPSHPVSVPGDGARRRRAANLKSGIDVEPRLWSELSALASKAA